MIADRLVVTADHVVAGAQHVAVFSASGVQHEAQVVRQDPAADLALLRVRELGAVPAVGLSSAGRPPPGRCVAALGSVVRAGIGIFCGIVSLIAPPHPGGYHRTLTDITAPPGVSGGALVDCETGQAVGIVTIGLVDLAGPGGTAGVHRRGGRRRAARRSCPTPPLWTDRDGEACLSAGRAGAIARCPANRAPAQRRRSVTIGPPGRQLPVPSARE